VTAPVGGPVDEDGGGAGGHGSRRQGQLVLVATPIGNLGDLSPRARQVLTEADLICCEDTRRTRALLSAMGIPAGGPGGDRLLSMHGHNEETRLERIKECVQSGGTVAVVSDAGTPGISDPGSLVVRAVADAGATVSVVPGPTSVVAALVVSGLSTDRFCFEGFLPRKGTERRVRLARVMADDRTTVLLEAPGRVGTTLADLAELDPSRPVVVVRELTKVHEEVWRGTLADGAQTFTAQAPRGEVVVVVGGAPPPEAVTTQAMEAAVRRRLVETPGEGPRQIADSLAAELGVPRRSVYEAVLRLRDEEQTAGS
jgi:16S rRNA (cytidine1402-2'-O)-methyltransferase